MEISDLVPGVLMGMGAFGVRVVSVDPGDPEGDPPVDAVVGMLVENFEYDPELVGQTLDFTWTEIMDREVLEERTWTILFTREEVEESDEASWARCHVSCDTIDEVPYAACGVIGSGIDPSTLESFPRPCPTLLGEDEELASWMVDYRYIWRFGRLEDESIRSVRLSPPTDVPRPH